MKRLKHSAAEHLGKREAVEQVFAFDLPPLSPDPVHGPAGDHDMAVRVVVQSAGMGMQHTGHADLATELFGVESEVFQDLSGSGHQQAVEGFLMAPSEGAQLRRQGKGHHKVLHW